MSLNEIKQKIYHSLSYFRTFCRWAVISFSCGILIGLAGTAFSYAMAAATGFRAKHPAVLLALPAGGVLIAAIYKLLKNENDNGTNQVISSIYTGERIPLRMAPCIFISTVVTHLLGGSAGREGAALQLGGSIGSSIGTLLHLDEKDMRLITMCGMSAAFSALFGTPVAAAIFPIEVVSVGILHYSALVPCAIASLTAHELALFCGLKPEAFPFTGIPAFSLKNGCMAGLLAAGCALVSVLFCIMLHQASHLYHHFFKNVYVRAAAGGVIVVLLTAAVGNQAYNGAGIPYIEQFFADGRVFPAAFLLKILFTACTLGAGFKGGEIVPAFYIGAAFGCLFGMTGLLPAGLCTAIGMASVFCGVTNCPAASLFISLELFGADGMAYYLLAVSISYMLSGYFGLYSSQKILYSKEKALFINRKAG